MTGVQGRIALVTGAGRGLGRASAELLTSRGARVMGVARGEDELAALRLEYTVADLGTPEGCARAVAETERRQIDLHIGAFPSCAVDADVAVRLLFPARA